MADLLTNATDDATSSPVEATVPILLTITGKIPQGRVRITGDIGGGEATAFTFNAGDPIAFVRLEFTTGVTFKAYLEDTNADSDTDVTVTYIDVA